MDISGSTVTCEVCGKVAAPNEDFRIFTGARCAEGDKPHPKTRKLRPVRSLKKYIYVVVCGAEECGTTGIGRVWRGV